MLEIMDQIDCWRAILIFRWECEIGEVISFFERI